MILGFQAERLRWPAAADLYVYLRRLTEREYRKSTADIRQGDRSPRLVGTYYPVERSGSGLHRLLSVTPVGFESQQDGE